MDKRVEYLKAVYSRNAYTNNYIVGTHEDGIIVAYFLKNTHFSEYSHKAESSGKNGANSIALRYDQSEKILRILRARAVAIVPICTESELEELASCWNGKPCKQKNRGKAFERLVTEWAGQTWTDDKIPWWLGPDLVIDEIPYQIKYDRCGFTNERQIALAGLR